MNTSDTLLTQLGLSLKEAEIYKLLLTLGKVPAAKIVTKSGIKRTTIYSIVEGLAEKGLVEKDESQPVVRFRAKHPYALKDFLDTRLENIKKVDYSLDAALPQFLQLFHESQNRPGVKFLEGKEGIKRIYDDILATGENFFLVRAGYEPVYENQIVPEITKEFIKKRVKKGIRVTAITPKQPQSDSSKDALHLLTRQWVPPKYYDTPVEINIYGDKIAIIAYAEELVGVVIESTLIAGSFKQLFELARLGSAVTMKST